jgi:hypothetical protein
MDATMALQSIDARLSEQKPQANPPVERLLVFLQNAQVRLSG